MPTGKVQGIVEPLLETPKDDPSFRMLQRIHEGQELRGRLATTL